jgi:methyltransferase (TIGR00027 family)
MLMTRKVLPQIAPHAVNASHGRASEIAGAAAGGGAVTTATFTTASRRERSVLDRSMADEPLVANVSDTARWVAQYRAVESARADALFRDPLAGRLAGAQGQAIVAGVPRKLRSGWSIVARTKLIDDLVATSVSEGCTRVVNLAAGLDTRPYRLALPASLTWIEADLPAILDEKEQALAGERPACALSRERVDLADAEARRAFLARATAGDAATLVITEGLLGYLNGDIVAALGRDLASRPAVRWWLLDLFSPGALAMIKSTRGHRAAAMLNFAPEDGVAFFERLGWRALEIRSIVRAAVRFRRAPWRIRPLLWLPDPDPRRPGQSRWFAVTRLARA